MPLPQVKAKGPLVFAMMRCTKDASVRVSRLARIFFREPSPRNPFHFDTPENWRLIVTQYDVDALSAVWHIHGLAQPSIAWVTGLGELNKKPGHIIYNCIPDLLSRLTEIVVKKDVTVEDAHEHVQCAPLRVRLGRGFVQGAVGRVKVCSGCCVAF